uniref:Uncharacterized protein n=1 Tax=viral metagenome TaxID=1070528 RepID=A0A6H1ZKM2_9ZZZZ
MIQNITLHEEWAEVEELIKGKLDDLLLDFPISSDFQTIAINSLANRKAYELLVEFLKEVGFNKGNTVSGIKRDLT